MYQNFAEKGVKTIEVMKFWKSVQVHIYTSIFFNNIIIHCGLNLSAIVCTNIAIPVFCKNRIIHSTILASIFRRYVKSS